MSDRSKNGNKRSLVVAVGGVLASSWRRVPLSPPEIDPDLIHLSAVERVSEVLRYKFLQLEYAISSGGGIRAWLKLNILLAATLLIPALLVVPLFTWIMGSFVTLTGFLFATAQNLLYTLLTIIAFTFLLIVFVFSLQKIWELKMKGRHVGRR